MATLEEVYQKVLADEDEREAFAKAAPDESALAEFLAQRGCEATPQEARAFVEEKFSRTGELAGEELEDVAGGDCTEPASVVSGNWNIGSAAAAPGATLTEL